MKRIPLFFIIMAIVFSTSACSAKKPLDLSAVKTKNVLSVLKDLTQFYEAKNLDSFMAYVTTDYQERELFSRSLTEVFAKYKTIHFNIQYTRMLVTIQDRGQIKVSCNWDAEWVAPAGTSQKSGGRATFSFDQTNFKLVAIDGKNPFIPTENTMKQ
jgi:hypothetical protein